MVEGDRQSASLVIRLFGTFEVQIDGKPMSQPRTRKGQWLLALLVLRQGRPVDRIWLAGQLWPESSESQALANLRLSLSDLRRCLGCEAVRLIAPTSQELAFDLTGAPADVCLFDPYAVSTQRTQWEEAIALYRGSLLESCTEEWVLQERQARASVSGNVGTHGHSGLAYAQDDYASARVYHQESLAIRRENGNWIGVAASLNNLGSIAFIQGDYNIGRAHFEDMKRAWKSAERSETEEAFPTLS